MDYGTWMTAALAIAGVEELVDDVLREKNDGLGRAAAVARGVEVSAESDYARGQPGA